MSRSRRPPRKAFRILVFVLTLPGSIAPAHASSKVLVAAAGQPAPGGGVFARPGSSAWPAAAGAGWVAFRESSAIILVRATHPADRVQVARLGEPAPGGGTFAQFLGRPAVNANGEVAFLAVLAGLDDGPHPGLEAPAGIFVFRDHQLMVAARSGEGTAAGRLDLVAPVEPLAAPSTAAVPERTPALNDAGDVAFLAGVQGSLRTTGAIFLARAGRGPLPQVAIGDAYDGGTFVTLGPPALNNHGLITFHATVADDDPADDGDPLDGLFAANGTGVSLLVRDGLRVPPADAPLARFDDAIAVNDRGQVAFVAEAQSGMDESDAEDLDGPGVFLYSAGIVIPVAHPGLAIGPDRVQGVSLGASAGGHIALPALGPDGGLAVFLSLTGGKEAIATFDGRALTPLVDPTGSYVTIESPPALDARGGVVLGARLADGAHAIIYRGADATISRLAEGTPLAGPARSPFSAPLLNDRGDVVFRAALAGGPSGGGVFLARDGALVPLVRAGDPSPQANGAPFLDLVGEPSLNAQGAVAFAATVKGRGRGVYVAGADGLSAIAVRGDPAPGEPGTTFAAVGPNPMINDEGVVAFRGITVFRPTPPGPASRRHGIFLADDEGIHALVYAPGPSPAGLPFLRLWDPIITDGPRVVFRAPLGLTAAITSGFFVADLGGIFSLAMEQDALAGGVTLTGFTGDPAVGPGGRMAFLGSRARPIAPGSRLLRPLGPAIVQRSAEGLGLVVAQDMPGPQGGTFRDLGLPSVNRQGHVAFRGSFWPSTGGTAGIFLARGGGLEPALQRGETTPLGGRFAFLEGRLALNAHDEIAFTAADMSAGNAGVFVASPATLAVSALTLRRTDTGDSDRLRLRLHLAPGRISNGVDPADEPITLSLTDADGVLWSATVPAGGLERRRCAFVFAGDRHLALGRRLGALRLRVGRRGQLSLAATSMWLDLAGGERQLTAPFRVGLEVGDDSASALVTCRSHRRGLRCAGF